MIQTETILNVADNSGAKKVLCIRVLGGTRRRYAGIGDVITVTVKEAIPHAKVKKGDVMRAVIVRTAQSMKRMDDTWVRFDENAAVMLSDSGEPVGTRIFGSGCKRAEKSRIHEDYFAGARGVVTLEPRSLRPFWRRDVVVRLGAWMFPGCGAERFQEGYLK